MRECRFPSLSPTSWTARNSSTATAQLSSTNPTSPRRPGAPLTYKDVARRARAQAAALDRLGVGAGARVAVVSHNSARLLTSFFGVSGYGRVLVPVNFRLRAEEVAYIVEHSGAEVLLVDPELEDALKDVKARHRFVIGAETDAEFFDGDHEPVRHAVGENDTATINYTSGTTARPKGVQLTHRNLWLNAVLMGLHLGVSDRDVYLHTLPMFHANGWGMPYVVTGLGAKQIVLRKVDGAEILRRVEEHGVTLLNGAPTVIAMVLAAAKEWDGADPRPGPGPRRGGRRAAAEHRHPAGRGRARLAVQPDLRPDRDRPAGHREPHPRRSGTACPAWSARGT